MRRIITTIAALIILHTMVVAQNITGVTIDRLNMKRSGQFMTIKMNIGLESLKVRVDNATVIAPMLVGQTDSVALESLAIYGRNRYYQYIRNNSPLVAEGKGGNYRASEVPDTMTYQVIVPYQPWMDGACLKVERREYGCCHKLLNKESVGLGYYQELKFAPKFIFAPQRAITTKTRFISGSAFIDFPVSQTIIYPDYRNNREELGKIIASIDSVNNDPDNTIMAISIKGFASPESPYDNNTRLAKGRTQALKEYVQQLYHFAPDFIQTSYEPEDWAGLRAYVAASQLEHRNEILAIIDCNREPDNKEWVLKSTYREEYKYLLGHCYPALRHSDYKIEYNIRQYDDIEEIKRVFAESPQKLSLNEFNRLAQLYEPGSDEWSDVFETAVRMYPNDADANLNAAVSKMQHNELLRVQRYLDKAGNSPQAIYARGVYAALLKQYDTAIELLGQAQAMGINEAADAIAQIEKLK